MDREKYRELFLSETRAHLYDALKALSARETGGPPPVDEIFRHFHSIKGMAGSMGLDAVATLAHAAEDLLSGARQAGLDGAGARLVQEAADHITGMVDVFEGGGAPAAEPVLESRLRGAVPESGDSQKNGGAAGGGVGSGGTRAARVSGVPSELPHLAFRVEIDPGSRMPATRAFMVVKRLKALGIEFDSEPSEAELRGGSVRPTVLLLRLPAGTGRERIENSIAGVPEVRTASVELREPSRPSRAVAKSKLPVRVSPEILDRLQEQAGELLMVQREIESCPAVRDDLRLRDALNVLNRAVRSLGDTITRARLVPLDLVTGRIPVRVRDLAQRLGKEVEAGVSGDDVGLDRSHVEKLEAPLLHLIRNAVDHGIETPRERAAAGKPPCGTITVSAARGGRGVKIVVSDDGRGLDHERIREAAVARGVVSPDRALSLNQQELFDLICLPGFSTARTVSDVSGRGVGMDAVRQAVSEMGGELSISSTPGVGTNVTLDLPVSLVQLHAMIVEASGGTYAIPTANIAEVVEVARGEVLAEAGRPLIRWRGVSIPVRSLSEILGVQASPPGGVFRFLVLEFKGKHMGLRVDRIETEAEIVMRPLGVPLNLVPGFAGYSILGGGRPVLIVDPIKLAGATAFA